MVVFVSNKLNQRRVSSVGFKNSNIYMVNCRTEKRVRAELNFTEKLITTHSCTQFGYTETVSSKGLLIFVSSLPSLILDL
jgi:hypothetical protein